MQAMTDDVQQAAKDSKIKAAIIASGTHKHFSQTKAFLESGIPVFVEKPLSGGFSLSFLKIKKK